MGLHNVLGLWQLTAHILALVLSLCIVVPISFHLKDFRGHCLLFSNGTWRESDGQFVVDWASQVYCDYNITWAGISVLISLVQSYLSIAHLCQGSESSFLGAFVDVVLSLVLSVSSLIGAVIITVGYHTWCTAIMRRFDACEDATTNDIDRLDDIDTSMFYTQFGTAQFGAWSAWACWVGLTVCALLKLCKYHQQENIRVSMARERARVIRNGRHALVD